MSVTESGARGGSRVKQAIPTRPFEAHVAPQPVAHFIVYKTAKQNPTNVRLSLYSGGGI